MPTVLPGSPIFTLYSLMFISIEKEISEMNLDIDCVFRLFFSLKYDLLYRLGLYGISACFCSSTLNLSQSVPYPYLNKLPISSVKE